MAVVKTFGVDLTPADMGEPYIFFRALDGREISSRDKIMRCTDTLIGTKTYSSRTPPKDETNTDKLGDCNADATFVWGYAKITGIQTGTWQSVSDERWFNVGGSYVHVYNNTNYSATALVVYSFYIDAGEVFVEEQLKIERVFLNDFGQFNDYPGFTLNYHLWCCSFE